MKEAMQKKMEPTTVCRVQAAGFRAFGRLWGRYWCQTGEQRKEQRDWFRVISLFDWLLAEKERVDQKRKYYIRDFPEAVAGMHA